MMLSLRESGIDPYNLPNTVKEIEQICLDIGCVFQIQDDFIDCFGDESVTGKKGTDIQDGKCTWFIVKALEDANPKQLKILQKNYGKKDKVDLIRNVYNELKLKEKCLEFQNGERTRILKEIKQLKGNLPRKTLSGIVNQLHK